MPIPDFKHIGVAVFAERNLGAGDKSAGMIAPHKRLDVGDVATLAVGVFAEFIDMVSPRTVAVAEPLVEVPTTDAMPTAVGRGDADVVFVEVFEKWVHGAVVGYMTFRAATKLLLFCEVKTFYVRKMMF